VNNQNLLYSDNEPEDSLQYTKYPRNRTSGCHPSLRGDEAIAQERYSDYFVRDRTCRYTGAAVYTSLARAIS
jgi:hypothetical protein